MKRRGPKIEKVIALAGAEERQCGEATGRSRSQLNDHLRRLAELNAYRESYAAKLPRASDLNSAHWKDYRNFLAKLDEAVRSQQQIVRDCERTLESHRRRWLQKRQRLESLERVRERYLTQAAIHADRLEQRVLDDLPSPPDLFDNGDD